MSAYIRDFVKCEICADPDGHWACPLFGSVYPHGYYCGVNRQEIKDPFSQQPWCPIIPDPPHGRLIDADALIEKVIAKYLEHERKGELVFAAVEIKQDIVDLISDAPTIILAEEDK